MTPAFQRILSILGLCLLLNGCSHMMFYPMKDHVTDPRQLGLNSEDVYLHTEDGLRLHGWFLRAQQVEQGTILFLHGNGENISTHLRSVWWLPAQGYNVFLLDYRGYGKSQGSPSLTGLHRDMESALQHLFQRQDIDTNRIIVFGQSIGAAVSISTLADSPYRHRVTGLVVEGGFPSYRQLARDLLSRSWLTWLFQWPLSYSIPDDYQPGTDIARLSPMPILIIHSQADQIIPFAHGEHLFEVAPEPKRFWRLQDARHIAALYNQSGQERFLDYLKHFILTESRGHTTQAAPQVGIQRH